MTSSRYNTHCDANLRVLFHLTVYILLHPSLPSSFYTGLLLTSQLHNAGQLSAWCLHFVSSNYVVFKDKEEFSHLTGENMGYINEHRWPPFSYEQAMEEYRKKYLEEESDESAEEGRDTDDEDDSDGESKKEESGADTTTKKKRLRSGSLTGRKAKSKKRRSKQTAAGAAAVRTANKCKVM